MTSGAYGGAFVQIGHGGEDAEGQVGGVYTRTIQIADDGSNGVRNVDWVTSNTGGGDVQLDPAMTANVAVTVGGDIVMEHLSTKNPWVEDTDNPGDPAKIKMDDAYTLIGHGGANTTENTSTAIRQFWDKTGDVTVIATGSLALRSGGGNNGWYTRIGHGATRSDRQSNGREVLFSGNVVVDVGTELTMNANWAPSMYGEIIGNGGFGDAHSDFAQGNPVAIGHGSTRDATEINFDGDVMVTVRGGDATLTSGKGLDASFVQIGNGGSGGFNSSGNADDVGQFTGDVTLDVLAGNLLMQANPDGVAYIIEPINPYTSTQELTNSYVLIGNGGAQWRRDDAIANGEVTVRVSGDLTMLATERQQGQGPDDPRLIGGFVQIGNANSGNDALGTANGDVYVEVGNDLRMRGGRGEGDVLANANRGSYAQIGNGGAQLDSTMPGITGDIVVNVGHNLTTEDGDGGNDNYVQIGHGDWMRDNPGFSGSGNRQGDIEVKVGNTASFDHTLVGHRDGAIASGAGFGDVAIGVSRSNPFYGGTGRLIAENGSVFSSGTDIVLGELRFYMPGRSSNLMATDSVLNGWIFTGADTDFQAPVAAGRMVSGVQASFQRDDEVYLQPDWWSDNTGAATVSGGEPFPNGAVANVASPGGFANLAALGPGAFRDGTTNDAHGESTYLGIGINVPGVLNHTLYYDAIEAVSPLVPDGGGGAGGGGGGGFLPPVEVPPLLASVFMPDFDLFNFLFFNQAGADLFGYTEGDWLILGDVTDGGGDTTGGLGPRQPGWLFGAKGRVLTPEEEAAERRRRARYHAQVSNGGRVFWVYDVGTREYSSFRLFGTPSSPSP